MIPFPDKKYNIIYADPPWSYKVWSEDKKIAQGTAKKHYSTMSIEDICNLPSAKSILCDIFGVLSNNGLK